MIFQHFRGQRLFQDCLEKLWCPDVLERRISADILRTLLFQNVFASVSGVLEDDGVAKIGREESVRMSSTDLCFSRLFQPFRERRLFQDCLEKRWCQDVSDGRISADILQTLLFDNVFASVSGAFKTIMHEDQKGRICAHVLE